MGIIKGRNLMLFIKDENNEYKSIAYATSHSLDISTDTISISTKDTGNGKFTSTTPNQISYTLSSDNLCADDGAGYNYGDILQLQLDQTVIDFVFSLKGEGTLPVDGWTPSTTGTRLKGQGYITSCSISAPNEDNASISISIEGTGELTLLS